MKRSCLSLLVPAAASLVSVAFQPSASAASVTWTGTSSQGKWNTASNWSPANVPVNGDDVSLVQSGSRNLSITLGRAYPAPGLNSLLISADGSGNVSLNASKNFTVLGTESIGFFGKGSFNQNGGVHNAGAIDLAGGADTDLGTYVLKRGRLNVETDLLVGSLGKGLFTQRGGVANILGDLVINQNDAAESSFTLQRGTLNVAGSTVVAESGLGYYTQSGGSSTHGTFIAGNQASGQAQVQIGGRQFRADTVIFGNDGVAQVQKTSGRMIVAGDLILGNNAGGIGLMERAANGGNIEVGGDMILGNSGIGMYFAEGGRVTVRGSLQIGVDPAAFGSFETFGASITAGSIIIGEGGSFSAARVNEDKTTGIVRVSGDFLNLSGDGAAQFTSLAELQIARGSETTLTVVGEDQGAIDAGNEWFTLTLESNAVLSLEGSLDNALYVDWFNITPTTLLQLDRLVFGNGINIYYNGDVTANRYLGGATWDLGNGGQLIPYYFDDESAAGTLSASSSSQTIGAVPEPSVALLILFGAGALACRRSRRVTVS
jgi:hypothetical protein